MERYGYVRVSAKDQNPERQLLAMQEQKIREKNIYLDQISGQNFSKPQYGKLLGKLKKGDVIVIKSIDRLGRNDKDPAVFYQCNEYQYSGRVMCSNHYISQESLLKKVENAINLQISLAMDREKLL